MKRKDEIGTPFDDGIRRGVKEKYADKARAEIEHYEKHGYPTGTVTGPDPLDTDMQDAKRFLAQVNAADPATLGTGDAHHARRLHAELGNLSEALNGGDVRHAARAGMAFGKALDEMRVRLGATDRGLGRKNTKGRDESIKTRSRKKRAVDDCILRHYDKKAAQHTGKPEREICEHTAAELNRAYQAGNKEGKEVRGILMQLKKEEFTAEMVRSRVQARKKQNG